MNAGITNKIEAITEHVRRWSVANFGSQTSKWTGQELGPLAPLMGLGEELSELEEATEPSDVVDAIGDCLVYLCDWAGRTGFPLAQAILGWEEGRDPFDTSINAATLPRALCKAYGMMLHATLKRHQGIRGFSAADKYHEHMREAVGLLYFSLDRYAVLHVNTTAMECLETTWGHVQKRDWKKNKSQGTPG